MAMRLKNAKSVNIKRVVSKIAITVIVLWVGGVILSELGNVMLHTSSPFFKGLTLIGWTVGEFPLYNATNYAADCGNSSAGPVLASPPGGTTCITSTSGTGILTVIGIIALATVVLEFVDFNF